MVTRTEAPALTGEPFWKTVFLLAALYDGILGAVFFFFFRPIFAALSVPLPDTTSYLHLTAGYVFVQGVGYWLVYRDLLRNLGIVQVGIVYKAIYIAVAAYYLLIGQMPHAIFAWFGALDVVFLLLFVRFLGVAGAARVHR